MELTEREREILAFERREFFVYAGVKEQRIGQLFDVTMTRYYQELNALIDKPAALEHDPITVKRLRSIRQARQRSRSARRLGVG